MIVVNVELLLFLCWLILYMICCLLLLNVKSHPFFLNVVSTWVTCR